MDFDPFPGCIVSGKAWRDGVLIDDDVTLEEIHGHRLGPDVLLWLDLLRPSKADLEGVATELGLSPTLVEDALGPHERPKVTRHGDHFFFTVYGTRLVDPPSDAGRGRDSGGGVAHKTGAETPPDTQARLVTPRVSGLILPHAVVTIRLDDAFDMTPVIAAWEENADLLRYGSGALLHGLLDAVVDGHFETIQRLDDDMEDLEDALFEERRTGNAFLRTVFTFRKDLVALRRVVLPMREVVNGILRHRGERNNPLDAWYDDLYDHVLRASEWTESLRDMVTSVFETNLSLQDSRLNVIMKKLSGWGAIIAIPTAVTGWFGQNVPYPGFQDASGLWLSVGLIVVLAGGLYVAFKKRDWL